MGWQVYDPALLYVYVHASIRKYFESKGLGLPLIWLQQGALTDVLKDHKGTIEFLITGPDFDKKGSRTEIYADVKLSIFVKTRIVEDELFFHQRFVGAVIAATHKSIPVFLCGTKDANDARIGTLRYLPMDTISVSAKEPIGSVVEQLYELEIC